MLFVGFHGTSLNAANEIINSHKFNLSTGNKHWLGDGIYFYENINDAFAWKGTDESSVAEVVLFAVLDIDKTRYLDLDSDEGKFLFKRAMEIVAGLNINSKSTEQENQNAVMRVIWEESPHLIAISGSFANERRILKTLTDVRDRRKEISIKSNDYIAHLHMIERGEIYG